MASASDCVRSIEYSKLLSEGVFIDRGSFGEVYACSWNNKKCAVKKRMFGSEATNVSRQKEVSACKKWKSLNHSNLIIVYDVSLESPALYVLMEHASSGSLKKVLQLCTVDLPVEIQRKWATQIAEGMAYLHKNDIVHRDLKSANSKYENLKIKLFVARSNLKIELIVILNYNFTGRFL